MKSLVLAMGLLLAAGSPVERVGAYANAKVYLSEIPCHMPDSKEMKGGRVVYSDGKTVKLCWVEVENVIWIIDDEGTIAAEDGTRYK